MKKTVLFIIAILLMAFMLSACDNSNAPIIEKYYLNDSGSLIAQYSDGSVSDLGSLKDTIANGVEKIEINGNGFYVINDITTSIKAKLPRSYSIDANGCLIVTYTDTTNENLGKFGSDSINTIETIAISDDGFYVLNGIKTDIVAIEVYNVTFNTGYSAQVSNQVVKDGYKVERPQLERAGYILNGWYCNGEEWHFNSDTVKNHMSLSASWTAKTYTVQFENEKGDNPDNIIVTFDNPVNLPIVDEVEGYTFVGWYYNGTAADSSKWSIPDNVTLTAKWEANKYTVTLDSNGGNVSVSSLVVEYDKEFELPIPSNSYGVFVGWLYNDAPITDSQGNCLNKWTYLESITVTVDWTIKVYTVDDLKKMNTYLNGEFVLMNDLDMTDINWVPVGSQNKPFVGTLYGNHKTINNLKFTTSNGATGLFGWLNGTVNDVYFDNVQIDVKSITAESFIGTLCGYAKNATIKNVIVEGDVVSGAHSSDYLVLTGGICGGAENSTLSDIKNYANVSGYDLTGGVAASTYNCNLNVCENNGTVISTQSYAGGIIGDLTVIDYHESYTYEKLCNKGNITGYSYSGGIIGGLRESMLSTIKLNYCCNYGIIVIVDTTGSQIAAGGLIGGNAYEIELTECYNRGDITGKNAGGLVGNAYSAIFKRCYSSGTITTNASYAGGLGGWVTTAQAKDSVVFGSITGSELVCVACGTERAGTSVNIANLYYNCTCKYYSGTKTNYRFERDFYIDTLYWSEYNENTNKGQWVFSESNYPKLFWEE